VGLDVVSRAALGVVVAGATFSAGGCFNVHSVDPGVHLIDDFDDGDFQPTDPNFQPWGCYSVNPTTNQNYSCGHDGDTMDGSPYSLYLDFIVTDPMDGTQQHGGAAVSTSATAPENFALFKQITFSAKLASGNPPLPSAALLYLELHCRTAPATGSSSSDDLLLLTNIDYHSDWSTFSLELNSLVPPPWVSTQFEGGNVSCLERTDSFDFIVDAQLPDGKMGAGVLHVDDIYLR
jgi:hypothetical protein